MDTASMVSARTPPAGFDAVDPEYSVDGGYLLIFELVWRGTGRT